MRYIYKITNTINQKVYIGQTKDVDARWYKHNYNARTGRRSHLYDSIRKYGMENFTIEVIEECFDDQADDRERYWIAFFNSANNEYGYNKTYGGTGVNTWELNERKNETSKKISDSLKGHPVSIEEREKLSRAFKGRIISPEQRQKISSALKEGYRTGRIKKQVPPHYDRTGCHHSQKTKDALSAARSGKTYDEIYGPVRAEELKQRHRDRWNGANNPNYKDIDVNDIIHLIQHGYNNKEIAQMYNTTPQTIWYKLKKIGLTARKVRKEYANYV